MKSWTAKETCKDAKERHVIIFSKPQKDIILPIIKQAAVWTQVNALKCHPLLGYNLSLEGSCIIRPRDQSAGNSGSSWLVGVLTFLYML